MKPMIKVIITISILIALTAGFYYAGKTISAVTGKSILGWIIKEDECKDSEGLECFAKCLTDKEIILYVNPACPHCQKQKEDFGQAAGYLEIIDCSQQPEICREKELVGVPTWEINGKLFSGRQSLQKLSELSGCPLSQI